MIDVNTNLFKDIQIGNRRYRMIEEDISHPETIIARPPFSGIGNTSDSNDDNSETVEEDFRQINHEHPMEDDEFDEERDAVELNGGYLGD